MAKVYESDIDPDEFIRSFREEPSGLSALKRKTGKDNPAMETPRAAEAMPDTGSTAPDIDKEEYFTSQFVTNMDYMRPQQKFQMVEIHPEFMRTIKRILSYESGSVCSMKAYVNNVLAEHFKTYEEIIKKRL